MSTNKVSTSKEWVDVDHSTRTPINAKNIEVFLDEKNVTRDCYFARLPDKPLIKKKSTVGLLLRNDEGNRYCVDGYGGKDVAKDTFKGIVWWRYRKDKPE